MNKKLIIASVLSLTLLIGYSSAVRADDTTGPWHEQMVEQLAAKLGVSTDSIDSAMSEVGEQRRAEGQYRMQANLEERLQTLVDEGTLTSGQRDTWIAMHEEHLAESEAMRLSHREEMEAWFAEQGIDSSVLPARGMHRAQ